LIVGELIGRATLLGYDLPLSHVFGVIKELSHDITVGMDLMEPYEIVVDSKECGASFKRFPPTIEIM
jgi:hypothetical protein